MNTLSQTERSDLIRQDLAALLETVLTGAIGDDRETAERFVRFLGAVVSLYERHAVDRHGRCGLCRSADHWWQWRRRQPCSVYAELTSYLVSPSRRMELSTASRREG